MKIKEVQSVVNELLDEIQKNLFERAKKWLNDNTADVSSWDEFLKAVSEKKLIRASWCESSECSDSLKEKTEGVKVLNIPFAQPKKMSEYCAHCNKPSKVVALFSKSY